MSWHYLQEQEVDYLEPICLGGDPLPLLRSKTTHAEFYYNGKLTESYLDSLSGTTSAPLMESPGEGKLMSSVEDSHAKISAKQEKVKESQEVGQDSGVKWHALSVKYNPDTSGWKTHHCLFLEDLDWSCLTLPQWGSLQDGELWERITLPPLTGGTGHGFWATPAATDYKGSPTLKTVQRRIKHHPNGVRLPEDIARKKKIEVGSNLNPDFSECLMGWPIGWTDLKPLGMDRFQQWCNSHGISYTENKA